MNTAKIYYYKAYGLNIASALPCPELSPHTGEAEVNVRYGAVPDSLGDASVKGSYYQAAANRLLLIINGVAKYLVSEGKEILIEPNLPSKDEEVRLFLLGSAFGALLHQRGLLPLHGSAIEADGGAVVFLGPSGLGKSTLAGAFYKRGYRVMTDDVCVLSISPEKTPMVTPGYPQLKLGTKVARKLGENFSKLRRLQAELGKHGLPLREGYCDQPLPLRRLYLLSTGGTQGFKVIPLEGVEKLTVLLNNTYRYCLLAGQDNKVLHFKLCGVLAQFASVSRVIRPRTPFLVHKVHKLVNLLESDWSQ
jgi:hypothetical protein